MINSNTYFQQGEIKKRVGYGFSLPSKPSSFDKRFLYLFKFLFFGRLKPYPTEFYDLTPWKQNQSPVGRVALIPTLIYLLKYMIVQWKFSYQFLINMKHMFYAYLRRDEGNPTYGFSNIKSLSAKIFFMPILTNQKSLTLSDQFIIPTDKLINSFSFSTKVEYATAGLDNQLFVSKYKINLPSIEEIRVFIEDELESLR